MEKLDVYHKYVKNLNIDSFVNEYLKDLTTESLMNLSKESESSTFEENSIIRQLISLYGISRDFHTGLIGLRSLLLTEITRRYYGSLK
jgi:hypothetical protein